MPHLTIDYTGNLRSLDTQALLTDANRRLAASGHFAEGDIKSRARMHDAFRIGTSDDPRAFVHATLAILPGRTDDVKALLSNLVLEASQVHVPPNHPELQLCAAVEEIHGPSYAKRALAAA